MSKIKSIGDRKIIGENEELLIYEPHVLQCPHPILMLHGMWATNRRWMRYGKFFSGYGFRVITPTLRHHYPGNCSSNELGKASVNDYIEDIANLIRRINECGLPGTGPLPQPIIFGHSMGGLIAQKLAAAGLAKMLVLLNSAPPAGVKLKTDWHYTFSILRYLPQMFFKRPFKPSLKLVSRYIINGVPKRFHAELYKDMVCESGKAALEIKFGKISVDFDNLQCPIRIIAGEKDRIVPYQTAEGIFKKIEGNWDVDVWIYEKFAHWIQAEPGWQEPANDILDWLNRYV